MVNRIINAVKTSGVLKERLFNAAYNSKKQAIMNGMVLTGKMIRFCIMFHTSKFPLFSFKVGG